MSVPADIARPQTGELRHWKADPNQYSQGKVHIVDDENAQKTYCGKWLSAMPGLYVATDATCLGCRNNVIGRRERRANQEKATRAWNAQREREEAEWHAFYRAYLASPEWRDRSRQVLDRAGGLCEGCRTRPAAQAHHTTYENVGEEFLWQLVAVCRPCHERFHTEREQRRAEAREGAA